MALLNEATLSTTLYFTQANTSFTAVAGLTGYHIVVDHCVHAGAAGAGTLQFIDGITAGIIGPTIQIPALTTIVIPEFGLVCPTKGNTLAVTTTRATGGTANHIYLRYHFEA